MSRAPKSRKPSLPNRPPRKRTVPPPPASRDGEKPAAPARRIEIPLISTPNDQLETEREMEELFNEEKVTHRHGGTEPERD